MPGSTNLTIRFQPNAAELEAQARARARVRELTAQLGELEQKLRAGAEALDRWHNEGGR